QSGNLVCGPDGQPINELCIDPVTSPFRLMIYELFVHHGWSAYKIARRFNQLKVEAWEGWTESAIKLLLKNPSSIGVFIWNRGRQEFDPEARKWIHVRNPRSEWVVRYKPELAIVPLE